LLLLFAGRATKIIERNEQPFFGNVELNPFLTDMNGKIIMTRVPLPF
jgi:hypothetical protein